MLPKTISLVSMLIGVVCLSSSLSAANPPVEVLNAVRPSLTFDFEACVSYLDGSSGDYSEFTAQKSTNSECSELTVIRDHLYRLNPNRNQHSCAPGVNGSTAMCIGGSEQCSYTYNNEKSLRIDVLVEPGPDGTGSLSELQFFSRAPEFFQFLNGESGINDYPTKLRVSVTRDGSEVFLSDEMTTSRDWTSRRIDFSGYSEMDITTATIFRIEILPYCLVGNQGKVQAWDIDDLVITAGCSNVKGGLITTNSSTDLCSNDTAHSVNSTVNGAKGDSFTWVLTDAANNIINLYSTGNISFQTLPGGTYKIWHIAYEGPISGLSQNSNLMNVVGCYDLSNAIMVNNRRVSIGDFTGPSLMRSFTICPGSGIEVIETQLSSQQGGIVTYVLTDQQDNIIATYNNPSINLANVAASTYRLYAVSSDGAILNFNVGNNLSQLDGCYAISTRIDIFKTDTVLDGGTIASNGQTDFVFCANDSELAINLQGSVGTNSTYLIVNDQDRILSLQNGPIVTFGNLTEQAFSILHVSYENGLLGLGLNSSLSALEGCFDLSNRIEINREQVDAGSITTNGSTETRLCLKNNDSQAVSVALTGAAGEFMTYLITDESGEILEITQLASNGVLDFSGTPAGVCLIWHLAYRGQISGLSVGQNATAITGDCFDLSNSITVIREVVESGVISGPSTYDICLNDPTQSSLTLDITGEAGAFMSWIVTDADGTVLETNTTGVFDFGGAPAGVCFIYHIAHSDEEILFGSDTNVNDIVLGCFELSTAVEVTRKRSESGSLAFGNGTTELTISITEGSTETISVDLNGSIGEESNYAILDANGIITGIQNSSDFAVVGTVSGTCQIVHVSSCGVIGGLTVGEDISGLTGCLDVSNPVTITKEVIDQPIIITAARITTMAGDTSISVCLGDTAADTLRAVFATMPVGNENTYFVTDDQGVILEINAGSLFDFTSTPTGVCRIYNVAYENAPLTGLVAMNNISQLSGNFALSNYIEVTRNTVAGGTLLTEDSLSTITTIVGDGVLDTLTVDLSGNVGDVSQYIITDMSGRIVGIPSLPIVFESEDPGTCFVWNISSLSGLEGLEVDSLVADLDGCFALSNPITVIREAAVVVDTLEGGSLALVSGGTTTTVCLNSTDTTVPVTLTGAVGDSLQYVITDTSGLILALSDSAIIDFAGTTSGICEIWNISYNGTLVGLEVNQDIDTLSGDFDLSNRVEVIRQSVDGGALLLPSGQDSITITVNDGQPDSIDVDLTGVIGDSTLWVITDDQGVVLELGGTPPFIFDEQVGGTCLIWNLSLIPEVTGLAVDQNVSGIEGCFDFSNPVTVIREAAVVVDTLEGGSLALVSGGTTTTICLNSTDTTVPVSLTGAIGDSLQFVITDTSGLILALSDNALLNFAGTQSGICEIWNISYNGTLVGLEVNQDIDTLSGDFDLSNRVEVIRQSVDGGTLLLPSGQDSITITVNDGQSDSIDVNLIGVIGDSTLWVITDDQGVVLELGATPPFIFDDQVAGTCLIWNLSLIPEVTGLAVDQNVSGLAGCFDFSNPVTVIRNTNTPPPTALVGFSFPDLVGDTINQLCIPLIVTNFDSIDTFGGSVAWDSTIVDFVGVEGFGIPNLDLGDFGTTAVSSGILTYSWIMDSSDTPASLMDGDTLFQICFDLIGADCDTTVVSVTGTPNPITVTMSGPTASDPSVPLNSSVTPGSIAVKIAPEVIEGGSINSSIDQLVFDFCVGDGLQDSVVVVFDTIPSGANTSYLVTDATGEILEIGLDSIFFFDATPGGTCNIYHIAYATAPLTGLAVGNNISDLSGNFDLSNNIRVDRSEVDGGTITTSGNTSIIVGDGLTDSLLINVFNTIGDTSTIVVTDLNGMILQLSNTSVAIDDNSPAGSCLIWNISYNMGLTGLAVDSLVSGLDGCYSLSNPITVTKTAFMSQMLTAGTINAAGGGTSIDLCIGENGGVVDLEVTGATGPAMRWMLSDTSGIIFAISIQPTFTLNGATPDTCNVRHIVFDSTLVGLNFGQDLDTLSGNFMLSNVVGVHKSIIPSGFINLSDGSLSASITTVDGNIDTLVVESSTVAADTTSFILVNEQGVIQLLQSSDEFYFENQPTGVCRIYQISYDFGLAGLTTGIDIDTLSGCYALSNIITVTKTSNISVSGGIVTTPIGNNISICQTDQVSDTIMASVTSNLGPNSAWVITDTTGVITQLPAGPPFVLDTVPAGVCQIWHLSFETIMGLNLNANVSGLTGTFDFNDIPVTVTKNETNGGVLTTATGMSFDTILLGNSPSDSLFVDLSGTIMGDTTSWVVTDTLGNIILLPEGPPFTLDVLTPGVCRLWHLSYADGLSGLQTGNTIPQDLDGCYDFSDSIQIIKVNAPSALANGGVITNSTGGTEFTFCLGDAVLDSMVVNVVGQSGSNFSYIVTNQAGNIISIQDTLQSLQTSSTVRVEYNTDTLFLYHIAYNLPLNGFQVPFNISGLNGIFDLSDPITLIREQVNGGSISTTSNTTILAGDGVIDSVVVNELFTPIGDSLKWVVIDSLGVILDFPSDSPFTFETYSAGDYELARLAHSSQTTGIAIGNNISQLDGCFEFSNFIDITIDVATLNGGLLMTSDSMNIAEFCFTSNYILDSIAVILTDTMGMEQSWVITDADGVITSLPMNPPFAVDNNDSLFIIRSISYDSTLVGLTIGEDVDTLSGNFLFSSSIEVTASAVNAGVLSTPSGETNFEFCVGDGVAPDLVSFVLTGAIGDNTQYVITDTLGEILLVPSSGNDFQDFEGFGNGVCRVYNLSSADEILGLQAGNNLTEVLGCYELSNFLTVVKNGVDANIIQSTPFALDNFISFCVNDGVLDSLTLSTNSTMGDYVYVVTDTANVISNILGGNVIDFEGTAFGECRIYGVSYTGTLVAAIGDDLDIDSLSNQCYEITAVPIVVSKTDCSLPIINEVFDDQRVEIRNAGTGTTDISNRYLCGAGMQYARVGDLAIDCGDLVLSPGETVVLELTGNVGANTNVPINSADDELALYRNNFGFGNSVNMMHYVEWGSTGHNRSDEAVIAMLWQTGEMAPAITNGQSLKYDGDGILGIDWSVGTPTPCADNLTTEPNTGKQVTYLLYPNPATDYMTVMVSDLIEDTGTLQIYDSYGKIISTRSVRRGEEYFIDLAAFGPGVYYTKVISGYVAHTRRMIIMK